MGFRYHRSVKILPGVHLNFSKSGVSLSIGGSPLTFNLGEHARRITASLPGTGWSWSKRFGGREGERRREGGTADRRLDGRR